MSDAESLMSDDFNNAPRNRTKGYFDPQKDRQFRC